MRRLRARRAAALIGRRRREGFCRHAAVQDRSERTPLTVDTIPFGLELAKRGPENRRDVYRHSGSWLTGMDQLRGSEAERLRSQQVRGVRGCRSRW